MYYVYWKQFPQKNYGIYDDVTLLFHTRVVSMVTKTRSNTLALLNACFLFSEIIIVKRSSQQVSHF